MKTSQHGKKDTMLVAFPAHCGKAARLVASFSVTEYEVPLLFVPA